MKIAVIMPTYQREDGKTPWFLRRSLSSIFAQTHTDLKVFLIGDKYENDVEFNYVAGFFNDGRIWAKNLDRAAEREKYQDKYTLWCCGGVTAFNIALEQALAEGYEYVCGLDHDDFWDSNHLEVINEVIEKRKADWICTRSTYGGNILPMTPSANKWVLFTPVGGGVINSSVCFNRKTIPLSYRNVYEETGIAIPADADLWDRVAVHISQNKLVSICVNKVTCHHDEEGYLWK